VTELAALIEPGATVAVADGAGMPLAVLGELSDAARVVGGVRLVLGWCPGVLDGLDPSAFADVRAMMGGYGLRRLIDAGSIDYLPVRLGAAPALVRDVLRPDLLVASVVPVPGGFRFGTEASWLRTAVDGGAVVAAVVRPELACADAGQPLPADRVVVVGEDGSGPTEVAWGRPVDIHRCIAERVAALIPPGARLQYGPGAVGTAIVDALRRPVHVDTGMITDAVVALDRRGLLLGLPVGPFLGGSSQLYGWADGRPMLRGLEVTHHPGRLTSGPPLIAVNTALEIDLDGQVNVERIGESAVAGIGGHPDYTFAASGAPGGLSIIALPSVHGGRSTLVERISAPATTPSHDVDVIVTELGVADLRGLGRRERRRAIGRLWGCD
jgi:acyl-CoA hydrolase